MPTLRPIEAPAPARQDGGRTSPGRPCRGTRRDLQHPDRDPDRRQLVAQEQEPFGSILSCIDSRVPPELLFDTGLGDLYVCAQAGRRSARWSPVPSSTGP
ncbi:hypothetical protein OG293_34920 [Streptomyces sp. NBC_00829]|nr:hypothetical protein OG293_34920 [Streptomyces sp. NBC_00829]